MSKNSVGDVLNLNFTVTSGTVGNTLTLDFGVFKRVGHNSRWYFSEVVEPICARTLAEPTASDLQVSAMVALWHTVDWMAEEQGRKLSLMRNELCAVHPDLRYIQAAANVIKHRRVIGWTKELAELDVLEMGPGDVLHYRFKDGQFLSGSDLLSFGGNVFRAGFNAAPCTD